EASDPPLRTEVIDDWTGTVDRIRDPEQTQLVWYGEVGDEQTTIWANFQGANPNEELVEINVRRSVFYPVEHHLNYITVRGFELAQAASPWAPPTADQPGLIGPNWAKGWIIEDNVIHDAQGSAVSIGQEVSTAALCRDVGRHNLRPPIDATTRHNRIHDCSLGTWLDWQTQGTRVSRNVFYQ